MAPDWEIKGRGERCSVTQRPFEDGESFYTLLYRDGAGFRREDVCEEAWQARNENIQPFSFWKSKFEPPPPPASEALKRETAEDLLRKYMEEPGPQHENTRYILAVMLERKRLLKPIEAKPGPDGRRLLIYEHVKTGEVFVVPDPELRLDQLEQVQAEVASLLQ